MIYSLYNDLSETMKEYFKSNSCPKILTDRGLTCGCPIDGISFFMNSLPARITSLPPSFLFLANVSFH